MEMSNTRIILITFIVSAIVVVLAINMTIQPVYDIGACTFNQYSCEFETPDWDGVCTTEMEDECCEDIRLCSGQLVDDPLDCYDKYCWTSGESCYPEFQIDAGNYKCTCKDVLQPL